MPSPNMDEIYRRHAKAVYAFLLAKLIENTFFAWL